MENCKEIDNKRYITMIHNEKCKECCTEYCGLRPMYINHKTNEVIHCPCKSCIIKMMCKTACPEFNKYANGIGVRILLESIEGI